jgi:hypothetical protein
MALAYFVIQAEQHFPSSWFALEMPFSIVLRRTRTVKQTPNENFSTVDEIISCRCLAIFGAGLIISPPRCPAGWAKLKIIPTIDGLRAASYDRSSPRGRRVGAIFFHNFQSFDDSL